MAGIHKPSDVAQERTAIVLVTRWHPLWFTFFFLYSTFVTIDGNTTTLPWGEHLFPVDPGAHDVQVHLGGGVGGPPKLNLANIKVDVAEGQTVHLRYRAPLTILQGGTLTRI